MFMFSEWKNAIGYLDSLEYLDAIWCVGYKPINKSLISSIRNLFNSLKNILPSPGAIYPLYDGSIMIEWYWNEYNYISAHIREINTFEIIANNNNQIQYHTYKLKEIKGN